MTRLFPRRCALALCALSLPLALAPACDSPSGGGGGAVGADPGAAEPAGAVEAPADTTPWTPGATTSKKPAYGAGCRYAAEVHDQLASNGALDDSLTISGPATGEITVDLSVSDGAGQTATAQVHMERMLVGKSWGAAFGTATWSGVTGSVVDGSVCFVAKLAPGQDVAGELSLVMKAPDGTHRSVAGSFSLPGDAITEVDPDVAADATLDIDLR